MHRFARFWRRGRRRGRRGRTGYSSAISERSLDFLYRDQFHAMHKDGVLTRLDTAFSRDQPQKVYVQDRMREHAADLFEWLERGAYFYVCGDVTRMAKDVESMLLDVIAKGSNGTLEHAAEYLTAMKKQKRYQRDVY